MNDALHFKGIPIKFNDMACRTVTRRKTWKRAGLRPNKTIIREWQVPCTYKMQDSGRTTIVMHPSFKEVLRRRLTNEQPKL